MQRWVWVMASLTACGGGAGPQAVAPTPQLGLEVVSSAARDGATPRALGLSGENKPNGTQYRYRQTVPEATPAYVLRRVGALELWLADATPAGWFAFYRTPPSGLGANGAYRAVLYGFDGQARWTLPLDPLLSRPTQLEIQDIRYHEGALYLNEACQTYARDADGQCSALLRVDPVNARVVWRTRPLVSNNILLPHEDVIVAGYGFTAEPDSLYLVDAATGTVRAALGLDSAHQYLEFRDGRLHVLTTNRVYVIRLAGRGRDR